MVLGGHGDTMVPMHRYTTIAGIPISNFLASDKLDEIVERTRHGGAEILALRQNSSAYDAPAASVAEMVDAIVHNRKRILPTVSILEGEYGHDEIAIGVPSVLGNNGMEQIILLEMNGEETAMFHNSASIVQTHIDLLKKMKNL
jgi:malate dehydrogenase